MNICAVRDKNKMTFALTSAVFRIITAVPITAEPILKIARNVTILKTICGICIVGHACLVTLIIIDSSGNKECRFTFVPHSTDDNESL